MPSHRILIIDDDEDSAVNLLTFLTKLGYHVTHASDGISALVKLEHAAPDVIILDFEMPGADGATVYDRLRDHPVSADIPILLISGYSSKEIKAKFAEKGIATRNIWFIPKPCDSEKVEQAIRRVLKT